MKTKTELTILATGLILSALIAPHAFADSLNQSGAGNSAYQNSNNSSINSNNTSVNSGNTSGSYNHLTATGGKAYSRSASSASSGSSSDNSVSIREDAQKRNPVSSAWAAPLAVGGESCMGSSSAGGQGVGFGLSVGTTWHDEACERRKDATQLWNMGQRNASLFLMCQDAAVAKAMQAAGTPCPVTESPATGAALAVAATDVPERAR